jgi:germination protein M
MKPNSMLARLAMAGLVAALAGGCSASTGDAGPLTTSAPFDEGSPPPPASVPTPAASVSAASPAGTQASTPAASAAPGTVSLKVYLLSAGKLLPVNRDVPRTVAVARAAMTALLAGPTASEASSSAGMTTAIPSDTLLLGISISNGVATVDLSREFESGGGSASMFGRLAQMTYTLTQFSTVTAVALHLDGQPVTTFSGEGIVLNRPVTRTDYVSFLPSIFVDRPAWGGDLGNPARITGLADVFEAQFLLEISTSNGTVIARQTVMASCGTGCVGTFDVTVSYSVDRAQPGYLTVYDRSAKDGSVVDRRVYSVTLDPA